MKVRGEVTYICAECGRPFKYDKKGTAKFCSPECFREKERRRYRAYYKSKRGDFRSEPEKPITTYPTKFDLTLIALKECGKTYAQAQIEKTLAGLPPIRVNV